jgi:glycosyltransferase involved in cell wall biosynthesis
MKIAWFTPLSQKSAIARFSVGVTAELSKMLDVELCYFDAGEVRDSAVTAKRFQSAASIPLSKLKAYDMVVYNVGNYLPFHREIYLLSQRWPGVCILHDFVMHHFFAAYYLEHLRDPGAYRAVLNRVYGSPDSVPERVWETDEVVRFPLFEEVTHGALGIITHSRFFKERVERSFAGPVTRIPLAFSSPSRHVEMSRSQFGIRDDQILVLTVGHVNPNKQVECVIHALSRLESSVSGSVVYVVAGSISPDYERKLKSIASARGLEKTVLFLGHVSDEVLHAYLTAADICVNLRYPTTEGASWSVIEEMLFAKPVIVTDTGSFSELPDDCVIKVRPRSEIEVANALRTLAQDPSERRSMGTRAKAFAETEFHSERYAKQVVDFIWEVQSAKPILGLADRVGIELWRMGAHADAAILEVVAAEMARAFGTKHLGAFGRAQPDNRRDPTSD